MTVMRRCALVLICNIVLTGCGGDGRHGTVQIPAPVQPPPPPPVKALPLDPALQAAARAEVNAALASKDPYVRLHAMEATRRTLGVSAKAVFLNGLSSDSPDVRFASAMAIGELKIPEAHDKLTQMVGDGDGNVAIAVRFALHRLGDTRFSKDLQLTAREPIREFRAQTAMVLGMLDEPTAIRVLRPMQKDPEPAVRIQVAEALWRLGDMEGLTSLVAAAQSKFVDDQMPALLGLAARRDALVLPHIHPYLTDEHVEVCLVAARAAGMLGSDEGYAIAAAGVKTSDARQRPLAALALGAIGRSDAQPLLAPLLKDPDADVRLSAAQAILQLKPPAARPQ